MDNGVTASARLHPIVHRPSSIVHRPSSIVHRPSSIVHRPSSIVHRPSSIVHRPSSIVHRPSSIVHRPSSIVHRPSRSLTSTETPCHNAPILTGDNSLIDLNQLIQSNMERQRHLQSHGI